MYIGFRIPHGFQVLRGWGWGAGTLIPADKEGLVLYSKVFCCVVWQVVLDILNSANHDRRPDCLATPL